MASLFSDSLRKIWPFSMPESDVRDSKELVHGLSLPESTKSFVFAIRVPEHDSTIYILSAHNFSKRSAIDAECLIREIRPDAVVAQVNKSAFGEGQVEESVLSSIPTSAFKVIKQLLVGSVNKEKYESAAGALVLKEIFGTGFNGHVLAAKKVAGEVGSSFMELESPFVTQGLTNKWLPRAYYGSAFSSSSGTFQITNDAHAQMLKLLSSHITQLGKELTPSSCVSNEIELDSDEVPPFAHSVYSLLVDLHYTFNGLPAIRKALTNARKMLSDVSRGESIDTEVISEVYLFQIAVENTSFSSFDCKNGSRDPKLA
ncbi:unnamed protein product [Thlaspi arvense]|uniref:Uncharacterized protein n=1 Tax=Thlaspi arvense TaxID=13288 RepID=A0AAU9S4B1_THLAR|nr:unnamed protein product [Thlaspi arvense]